MEKITWTWETWKEMWVASLYKQIEYLKTTKILYIDRFWGNDYFHIGDSYACGDNDMVESKRYYYKYILSCLESYSIYKKSKYPNLAREFYPPFDAILGGYLFAATLSDKENILKELGEVMECFKKKEEITDTYAYHIGYAIKYFLSDDFTRAKEHIMQAHVKNDYKDVIFGILDKNIQLIDTAIQRVINIHKRSNNKDTIFHTYSIEATALAKLAMMYGLEPDVSSPFIHKGLLEKTEGIEYEGIEEITSALEEANRRAGSLGSKISGWFK